MANVLDYSCVEFPEDLLRSIFIHQHKLAEKYIPIEVRNGLCLYDEIPADINNAKAQARIKDMSWRAVEEVAEAFEALDLGEITHFYEEMADALHFLVEKYLLCDFLPVEVDIDTVFSKGYAKTSLESFFTTEIDELEPFSLVSRRKGLDVAMAKFIKCCGLSCNCLKNKPWKQSQMLTDESKFRDKLLDEFTSFIDLCALAGFTAKSLYAMYIRKNQVNQFRQRSNY